MAKAPAGADAQQLCATPVAEFQQVLAGAIKERRLTAAHRRGFLRQVENCRSVYHLELARLKADFADLPGSSVCHSAQRELAEGLDIFDAIAARARELPLDSQETREAAGVFFNSTSPGLVRAVNGLYLLRHGVCIEELYAPFDAALTDSEISRSHIYLQ